jgi:hypothetical protein
MRNTAASRLEVLVVLFAFAGMLGCQGVSTGKPAIKAAASPGVLSAAPLSVTFGNVQIGTSQSQSSTLTNTGASNLTVTQAVVTGVGFSVSGLNLPLTLSPAQSATFSVVFNPQSSGAVSGSVALSNDGSPDIVIIALSATGVAAGSLNDSPTSFIFGSVQVGTSKSQTETLQNTGGQSVTISAATVTGAGFNFAGLSLPLTLAPNQSATFGVGFTPVSAGSSNGNLSLTVSGSTTSVDIALSGIGVTPGTLAASPASFTFTNVLVGQSQTQTETARNTGGSNATISQVTVSGTGFSISGISAPLVLTPGQSTSFTIKFSPQSAGNFSGSVLVASDASNSNLAIPLTGSAVAQTQGQLAVSTPINVGSVVVGLNGTHTGTLTATGATVTVNTVGISGPNASEFSVSGLSFPVTVTTSQPVNFTVKFTPGAAGAASATALFNSNASNSPSASLTGTGTSPTNHTVTLTWNASTTTGVTSYNVYRAVHGMSCGSYSNIGSTASPVTAYSDTQAGGQTLCYATTAVDSNGESVFSNVQIVSIP